VSQEKKEEKEERHEMLTGWGRAMFKMPCHL